MTASDLKLFALYAIIAASIILRVSVDSTGYRSPDSIYYLEVSQNLLEGNGLYHTNFYSSPEEKGTKAQTFLATWPFGYPLLIAVFAFLFSLPVFWASKLVNLFFLGLCFLIFRKINKEHGYLLSMITCSFTFLEVFSFTWSEGAFLFNLLWFGFVLHQYLQKKNNSTLLLQLFLSCLFMFSIRYIGGFSFIILGVLSIWFFLRKEYKKAVELFLISFSLFLLAGIYLYHNYLQTSYITGIERIYTNKESIGPFLWLLFVGIFNEVFVIRNYYFKGRPDWLFLATSFFQLLMLIFIYFKSTKGKKLEFVPADSLSLLYSVIGLTYLVVLISLRFFSHLDTFDYRLLSPFSICIYTAIMLFLVQPYRVALLAGSYKYIVILFGVSLLLNLPKVYLFKIFQNLFNGMAGL